MDGREGMTLQGSASYYLNRAGFGGSGGSGPGHNVHGAGGGSATAQAGGINTPPVFKTHSNPNIQVHPNVGISGGSVSGSAFQDCPNVCLHAILRDCHPRRKTTQRRPPGTGWKQKLAPLGDWMNSSAGLAFTPHVLHIQAGEDVAAKILAFAQQRPRALCILSGSGSVSAVTLRQPTTSGGTVTYEVEALLTC
ncbi:UNVERIFIED_CONTAM: AT-hook motif nuclear-localized protein 12 [Sesamum radiatum]|uniref:AT-hook motif nuclear-localized protein n=1 Tax=Sesamum radiatum TaxID=300843 RepID=A0AAW2TTM1_SESRA